MKSADSPEDALAFARTAPVEKDSGTYDWVIEYAKERYAESSERLKIVDAKAEFLLKFMGGLAIFLSAGLPFIFRDHLVVLPVFVPVVIGLILAGKKASKAIQPKMTSVPPSIRTAYSFAEDEENAQEKLFMLFHVVDSERAVTLSEKSVLIDATLKHFWRATSWACVGLVYTAIHISLFSGPAFPYVWSSLAFPCLLFVVGTVFSAWVKVPSSEEPRTSSTN